MLQNKGEAKFAPFTLRKFAPPVVYDDASILDITSDCIRVDLDRWD